MPLYFPRRLFRHAKSIDDVRENVIIDILQRHKKGCLKPFCDCRGELNAALAIKDVAVSFDKWMAPRCQSASGITKVVLP